MRGLGPHGDETIVCCACTRDSGPEYVGAGVVIAIDRDGLETSLELCAECAAILSELLVSSTTAALEANNAEMVRRLDRRREKSAAGTIPACICIAGLPIMAGCPRHDR